MEVPIPPFVFMFALKIIAYLQALIFCEISGRVV